MRPVQYFSPEYIEQCKEMTTEQILVFLDSFRRMHEKPTKSTRISLNIPDPLLKTFRQQCEFEGVKYQTKIKALMSEWLGHRSST